MAPVSPPDATEVAKFERDGCSKAMSSCRILYAFLGKRCVAENVETRPPAEQLISSSCQTDVPVSSNDVVVKSESECSVSVTDIGSSAYRMDKASELDPGSQRAVEASCTHGNDSNLRCRKCPIARKSMTRSDRVIVGMEAPASKESKKRRKVKPELDRLSVGEVDGGLNSENGEQSVTTKGTVAGKDDEFEKDSATGSANPPCPASTAKLEGKGEDVSDKLSTKSKRVRKNSKQREEQGRRVSILSFVENGPLIRSEAVRLDSAIDETDVHNLSAMDLASERNGMVEERSSLLSAETRNEELLEKTKSQAPKLPCSLKIASVCKEDATEKVVEALTPEKITVRIHTSQPKRGRMKVGTLNFDKVEDKNPVHGEEKSSVASPENRKKQRKSEAVEVRKSSRNKVKGKLSAETGEDNIVPQKDFFLPASKKHRQQEYDVLQKMDALATLESAGLKDENFQPSQHEFFVPASKKGKLQKKPESAREVCAMVTDNAGLSKNEGSSLIAKRPREDKQAQSIKGTIPINSEQLLKNEDFFKPASKKQKKMVTKAVKIQNSVAVPKLDTSANVGSGDGNTDFHFDLWMDAKLAAEENAQLCAGKRTHPFFAQHKVGQAWTLTSLSVAMDGGASHQPSTAADLEELVPCPPFHVTQIQEMKALELDWQGWNFVGNICAKKEKHSHPGGRLLRSPPQELSSLLRLEPSINNCETLRQQHKIRGASHGNILEPLLNYLKECASKFEVAEQRKAERDELLSLAYLESRFTAYHTDRARGHLELTDLLSSGTEECDFSKNLLWTDVYQPQSPEEVCGNKETVKSLNAWLQSWQSKTISCVSSSEGDKFQKKIDGADYSNDDRGWFQEDSDSDGNLSQDDALRNVLFLAGPVGCGKTAAIYACAREQGYTVIEVNSSDHRSGALVKHKFGEALESHRLGKWSSDNGALNNAPYLTNGRKSKETSAHSVDSQTEVKGITWGDTNINTCSVGRGKTHGRIAENKRIKRGPPAVNSYLTSKAEDLYTEKLPQCEDQQLTESLGKDMTLILFEDVDMVFEEDRGFMTALAQLAETTKRPIILTSNDKELSFPHTLDTHILEFKQPSTEELVAHAYMVCGAEGVSCRPKFLEQVVKACQHDLRKLLMFLQFWCQGHCSEREPRLVNTRDDTGAMINAKVRGSKSTGRLQDVDTTTARWLFELDAQHRIWPTLIPLTFPCSLAKTVASKCSATVLEAEQRICIAEVKQAEREAAQNAVLVNKLKRRHKDVEGMDSPLKAGAVVMSEREYVDADTSHETDLSQPCSTDANGSLLTPVKSLKEAKALARSPILRTKVRRQLAVVMSDSEDDAPNVTQIAKKVKHYEDLNSDPCMKSPEKAKMDSSSMCIKSLDPITSVENVLANAGSILESEHGKSSCHEEFSTCKFKRLKRQECRDAGIKCESEISNLELDIIGSVTERSGYDVHASSSQLPSKKAPNAKLSDTIPGNDTHVKNEEVQRVYTIGEKTCVDEMALEKHDFLQISCTSTLMSNGKSELKEGFIASGSTRSADDCEVTLQRPWKEEGKGKLLQPCLEVGGAMTCNHLCSDSTEKIPDSFTGLQHTLRCETPSQALQSPEISGKGTFQNGTDIETEGVEHNDLTQPSSSSPFSISEIPQLLGTCYGSLSTHILGKLEPDHDESASDCSQSISDAVNGLWSHLRDSWKEYNCMLDSASRDSLTVTQSLANLADTTSACDIISTFHGSNLSVLEKDLGISGFFENHDYKGPLQTCAQLAHTSLQLCVQECSTLFGSLKEMRISVSPEDVMLAMNDSCTLGKLATCEEYLESTGGLNFEIGPSCLEQDLRRLERKSTLQQRLSTGLPPRAHRAMIGAGFHEYTSFLARIGQLEQFRQSSTSTRRRGRGFQHYFSMHPWDLPEETIATLLQFCSFENN